MALNEKRTGLWRTLFIPAVLVVSVFLLYKSFSQTAAAEKPAQLNPVHYKIETARGQELTNTSIVGNCHLCHAYWVPIPKSIQTSNPRFAHGDIVLNHGNNDRCYNCHMISDRNNYVANDGGAVMVQRPEELCKRCHGLIYNDWVLGTHGKWTGKWKVEQKNDRKSYSCTQCHDPHDPKFKYNTIAPPPIWPKKYIRTKLDHNPSGAASQYLVDEEPREIF